MSYEARETAGAPQAREGAAGGSDERSRSEVTAAAPVDAGPARGRRSSIREEARTRARALIVARFTLVDLASAG
ncbi:MAG: hypothetical protein ACC742_15790 [Thermoanaerobaculales bacterium]